jgi:hypothetical protein
MRIELAPSGGQLRRSSPKSVIQEYWRTDHEEAPIAGLADFPPRIPLDVPSMFLLTAA